MSSVPCHMCGHTMSLAVNVNVTRLHLPVPFHLCYLRPTTGTKHQTRLHRAYTANAVPGHEAYICMSLQSIGKPRNRLIITMMVSASKVNQVATSHEPMQYQVMSMIMML